MSVQQDSSGRRSNEIELEVAGTPEEVWQAIATSEGVSSWLMPTEFEERDGKPVAIKMHFGTGMDSRTEITAWQPPRMYATTGEGWLPGSPPLASEWSVEARGGGKCVIRIVQSLFASTDEWDLQLESAKEALASFFKTLQLKLAHFRGQRTITQQLRAPCQGSDAEGWDALTTALGLKGMKVGDRFTAPAGVPALSGVVEYVTQDPFDAVMLLDQPAPGIALLGIAGMPGGPFQLAMGIHLYGEQGAATLARETPRWEGWFAQQFPAPAEPGQRA